MVLINLKDYDNCEKLGHDFIGIPTEKDIQQIGFATSFCIRCNLDRAGWKMPKSFWKRPKRKMKGEFGPN
jgi:hypothetical protein